MATLPSIPFYPQAFQEPMVPREGSLQPLTTLLEDTNNWHQHHLCGSNCQVCTGGEEGRKADGGSQPELQADISHNVGG